MMATAEQQQTGVLETYIIEIWSFHSKRIESVEADLLASANASDWKLMQIAHDFLAVHGFVDYKIERIFRLCADYRRKNT
jgi:hypothetical protein